VTCKETRKVKIEGGNATKDGKRGRRRGMEVVISFSGK